MDLFPENGEYTYNNAMSERQEIEQALAALEAQRAALGDAVVAPAIAALRDKLALVEANASPARRQRKLVTVLFADLVGFTALSEKMDPEDIQQVIKAYFERWKTIILQHGGNVEKFIGDAVMAVWGADTAREDDPEQAIQAALAMLQSLRERAIPAIPAEVADELHVRIGINTGLVLVGELAARVEFTVIGDTVNTASRLQTAAPVDSILISHDTFRHVRGLFEVRPLDPLELKGKSEPVQAYEVLRAKPRGFRPPERGIEGIETHMIGRQRELEILQQEWQAMLATRQARAVSVTGDAGIGKSRLLYEFQNWLEFQPAKPVVFQGRASEQLKSTPYALIRNLLAFRFEIQDSDTAAVARQKLEAGVAAIMGAEGRIKAHFIGHLIGLDFSASPHIQPILADARQISDRAEQYLSQFFGAVGRQQPLMMYLEDAHWADDNSLDLLSAVLKENRSAPLMILCLGRDGHGDRWLRWEDCVASVSHLSLAALNREDTVLMIQDILRRLPEIPPALLELITSEAEGNPFYVEELIKMLIEEGVVLVSNEGWQVAAERLTGLRIPSTLTGVLQARLDALPIMEREALQVAAVIGRSFWDGAVRQLLTAFQSTAQLPSAAETLETGSASSALAGLLQREVIYRKDTTTFNKNVEYAFKHNIFHEVTYETVLKSQRRTLHEEAARWLIASSGERADEFAGWIAHHFERAHNYSQAAWWYWRAGERAFARFADQDAESYFTRALNYTPMAQHGERYRLTLARMKVYDLVGKRQQQEADLLTLERLAEDMRDDQKRAEVALWRARFAEVTGDYGQAITLAQKAIRLAGELKAIKVEAEGNLVWGTALMRQGEYLAAAGQMQHALSQARMAQIAPLEAESLRQLGNVYWFQGKLAEATDCHHRALQLYRRLKDKRGESSALVSLGVVANELGEVEEALRRFEESLQLSRDIGDRLGEARGLNNMGDIQLNRGEYTAAAELFAQALALFRQIGNRHGIRVALANLSNTALQRGDYSLALRHNQDWLENCLEGGDRHSQGWAQLSLGEIYEQLGDLDAATALFTTALGIFREMDDQGGIAGTLCSLSNLHWRRGEHVLAVDQARQALALAEQQNDRRRAGFALADLARALHAAGDLEEAVNAYQQSASILREVGQVMAAVETELGLAELRLAQGETSQALVLAEDFIRLTKSHPAETLLDPYRAYLSCYRVLASVMDQRGWGIMETARRMVEERAAMITDERLRQSFLHSAAVREIVGKG